MMKKCPGCGIELPDRQLEASVRPNASGECLQTYHELSAYLMMHPDLTFRAQHAVDAYAAQHSGGATKTITTAFAVIGLYLAVECGYTGRQVQQAHMALANRNLQWPSLDLPTRPYAVFVTDVLAAREEPDRHEMLMKWARHVWDLWEHQREWAKDVCERYLKRAE